MDRYRDNQRFTFSTVIHRGERFSTVSHRVHRAPPPPPLCITFHCAPPRWAHCAHRTSTVVNHGEPRFIAVEVHRCPPRWGAVDPPRIHHRGEPVGPPQWKVDHNTTNRCLISSIVSVVFVLFYFLGFPFLHPSGGQPLYKLLFPNPPKPHTTDFEMINVVGCQSKDQGWSFRYHMTRLSSQRKKCRSGTTKGDSMGISSFPSRCTLHFYCRRTTS